MIHTTTKTFKNVAVQNPVLLTFKIVSGSAVISVSADNVNWVSVETITSDSARKLDCYGLLVKIEITGSVTYSESSLIEV